MSKCFTSIFTEPLTKERFARKGVLYYRLRGEIMQGVMLKTNNPFSICVNMCPWWTYRLMRYRDDDLTVGHWVEHGLDINGFYYRMTEPEENDASMRHCLDVFLTHFLPVLNETDSEDAFIRVMSEHSLETPPPYRKGENGVDVVDVDAWSGSVMGQLPHNQYVLLHKAVTDRTYEGVAALLPDSLLREEARLRRMNNNGHIALNPVVLEKWRTDQVFREELEQQVRDHAAMIREYGPDSSDEQLLADAQALIIPWV